MIREEEIYSRALELPFAERASFLDDACGEDESLRDRVEALLAANEEADAYFALPHAVGAMTAEEAPGDRIGRYKLLQKIGEGGCGVVYMAEQEEPIRRKVALKVIKLGMDTKAVIARFEAERQALALMDHPNIARVLDAGATETGRPFFVMELVRGIPITRYCDEQNLSTAERLHLFVQVCHAIQHAHEKSIIHRDIKPTNILVTMHDDVAVPKIIDFGIAKATQGRLTDKTVFTAFEQFIGTPAYMSPEQAQMNDLEVDTRSDIYSLGVLLYELLTGRPPFDPKTLQRSGIDEIRRIIREVEPPRPSTRFGTLDLADRLAIAKLRRTAPAQLSTLVRGDLDWIAMKALEKNRTRRYGTANDLAADIKKHLGNEPVLARPPSAGYRARKFAVRHKFGLLASSGVVVALAAGLALSRFVFREQPRLEPAVSVATSLEMTPGSSARSTPTATAPALAVRQVHMTKFPGTGGAACVSPDGRFFLYRGQGDEATLVDASSESLRKLGKANLGACFSADSKQIATLSGDRESGAELRVLNLDGSLARTLPKFTSDTLDYAWLHAWSSDGQQFAVVTRKDRSHTLAVIDARSGSLRTLRSTGGREADRVNFSPDGRWIVYDVAVDEKGSNTDLFVLDVATGETRALVQHAADDHLMGWDPRSNQILFSSNRRGNYDAWVIRCVEGHPVGEPVLVKSDLGEPEPVGFTASGAFYYAHRQWVQDIYSLPLDPETGRAKGVPVKTVDRFEGTNSAASWSPDGHRLAYSSRQPPFLIRILDTATQQDRVLAEGLYGPKWSPDGKSLLCFSQWDGEEKKLYVVDAASGSRTVVEDGKPAGSLSRSYQWAPEGGAIYYEYGLNEKPWTSTIVRRDLAARTEREIRRRDNGGFFAVSPNGRTLVYRADGKLHVMPVAGGEPKVVYEVPKGHYIPGWDVFTWSADGRAVYVCVWEFDRQAVNMPEAVKSELIRVPIDSGSPETVLTLPRVRYPHAHPDGTRLTFSAGQPRLELWAMENFLPEERERVVKDTSPPAPLEARSTPMVGAAPRISIRKLPLSPTARWFMSISQDGRYLAYMPKDTFDLAVCDMATGKSWTISKGTKEKSVESGAVISPDGQWIAYEMSGEAIFLSKIDGTGTRKVHERDGKKEEDWAEPEAWSADGTHLIFGLWYKSESPLLMSLDVTTGAKDVLAVRPKTSGRDSWFLSPDERMVARRRGDYPRMITLFDIKSGHEETLVERDADRIVGWVPGESRLVYSKTRSAESDLFAVEVKDGKAAGEPELIWNKWSSGNATSLGITRDGKIYYAVSNELWVMEGFLAASRTQGTEAWRTQTEIPPQEIIGPNRAILDQKLGLGAVYPSGWSIKSAVRQGSGGNVVEFTVPNEREARPRIIYWPTTPWANPANPANDFAKAGPKPSTPEEIDAWMRRRAEIGGGSRSQGGYVDYQHAPAGYVSRMVNGQRALSWSSGFRRNDQPWSEFMTLVYGDKIIASIGLQCPTAKAEAIRGKFEELVDSVRLP